MDNNLTTGIISSLVASVIFAILIVLLKESLVPLIRSFFYRGPNISGEWHTYHSNTPESKAVGRVFLTQRGEKIEGEATAFRSRTGEESEKMFEFKGYFKSGQLHFLYEDLNLKGLVLGVGLLKLTANSKVLAGKLLYLHQDLGTMDTYDFYFRR